MCRQASSYYEGAFILSDYVHTQNKYQFTEKKERPEISFKELGPFSFRGQK